MIREIRRHALRHGLTEEQVRHAWENFVAMRPRGDDVEVRFGYDASGKVGIQMVALVSVDGSYIVIHALPKGTEKVRRELGIPRKRGRGNG